MMAVGLPGCHLTWWPWHREPSSELLTDVELKEYREWATSVDFPVVNTPPPAQDLFAAEPRRLRDRTKDEIWDVTLQEAVRIALSHSHIIRSSGQFLSPGNPILANPNFAPSSYDVAIQESGVLFGQRGVEAALSEFDTQFTTTMTWGRDERIQNNLFDIGIQPGQTLKQETANFNASLQKSLATGGIISVTQQWDYEWDNVQSQLFPSVYTGQLRTDFRQPLLAGAGTEYTRIAGPITQNIEGITGVQQGVVIARINNDISVADFEQSVTNLVRDVEDLYWRLYLAYQQFDAESSVYQDALETWRGVNARAQAEAAGGGAIEETESYDLLYQIGFRRNAAQQNLYDVEAQLRRMMGLAPNDGRIIRPVDQPMIAEFRPDWHLMLNDALVRRVELRKQKWNIKSLELQLSAAKHLTKPRFDFRASYRVNGFGNDLFGPQSDGLTTQGLGSAYRTLTGGDQTGWDLGFEFSLPLGLRFAHAQVRNMQFQLAKARAALKAQEFEISHELAHAYRQLDSAYVAMRSSLNSKLNAESRLEAMAAVRQASPDRVSDLDLLRAQDRAAQAQSGYLQAVTDYNIAIMDLYYRSGQLLGLDNIHLAEGPWTPEARYDAAEKATCRAHSIPTDRFLHTEPAAFAQPVGDPSFVVPASDAGPALHGWPEPPGLPPETLEPLPGFEPLPTETPKPAPPKQQEAPPFDSPRLFPPAEYPAGRFPAAAAPPPETPPAATPPADVQPVGFPPADVSPADTPPADIPPSEFEPVDVPPANEAIPELLRRYLEKQVVASTDAHPEGESLRATQSSPHAQSQESDEHPPATPGRPHPWKMVEPDAWLPRHLIPARYVVDDQFVTPLRKASPSAAEPSLTATQPVDDMVRFPMPRPEGSPSSVAQPVIATCDVTDKDVMTVSLCDAFPTPLASPLILTAHVDDQGGSERPLPGAAPACYWKPLLATRDVNETDRFQLPLPDAPPALAKPLIMTRDALTRDAFRLPLPDTSPADFVRPLIVTRDVDDTDGFRLPLPNTSSEDLVSPLIVSRDVDDTDGFQSPLPEGASSVFEAPVIPARQVEMSEPEKFMAPLAEASAFAF